MSGFRVWLGFRLELLAVVAIAALLADHVRTRGGRTLLWGVIAGAGFVLFRFGYLLVSGSLEEKVGSWLPVTAAWSWMTIIGALIWFVHRKRPRKPYV